MLQFEDVVTKEWLEAALSSGLWDPIHGSDMAYQIETILENEWDYTVCPKHVADLSVTDAVRHPEMLGIMTEWLRGRYADLLEELPMKETVLLQRMMRVDDDWLAELAAGSATTGVYFSDEGIEDECDFWASHDQPYEALITITAKRSDIDWKGTILARLDYMTGGRECEVRLNENVDVLVHRVGIDGAEQAGFPREMNTGFKRPRADEMMMPKM